MNVPSVFRELNSLAQGRVRIGEPMRKHTSWRIGGPAELFVEPGDSGELERIIAFANNNEIPMVVIGAGSNLLVSDAGINGIVVKLGRLMSGVSCCGNEIITEAGARLADVAMAAKNAGLGGFEFAAGIPGTIGGAVVMNAGANGTNIGCLVKEVLLLDRAGNTFIKSKEDMKFGYRKSILQCIPDVAVAVTFICNQKDRTSIQTETDKHFSARKRSQPLGYPNAGSVFRNPPGDSAGRMIDVAGFKGYKVGDAQVSTIHANFIINLGNATAEDVMALITQIKTEVFSRFGVVLQPEIKFLGFIE